MNNALDVSLGKARLLAWDRQEIQSIGKLYSWLGFYVLSLPIFFNCLPPAYLLWQFSKSERSFPIHWWCLLQSIHSHTATLSRPLTHRLSFSLALPFSLLLAFRCACNAISYYLFPLWSILSGRLTNSLRVSSKLLGFSRQSIRFLIDCCSCSYSCCCCFGLTNIEYIHVTNIY